jgi:trehalose 6-phosphate phosphatase
MSCDPSAQKGGIEIQVAFKGKEHEKAGMDDHHHSPRRQAGRVIEFHTRHVAQELLDSWPEIRARVRSARRLAVFLDFDGTLVMLRRRPADVRVPPQTMRILTRLAAHRKTLVAIVSGRRLRDIQALMPVAGLRYFGLHGAEREDSRAALGKRTRRALARAKREARAELGVLPGIWLEDKVLSLAVHYRGATPAFIREAETALLRLLAPLGGCLTVLKGEKVWEILPQEISGKGPTVRALLDGLTGSTVAIYIGDDDSDESAFAALPGQITVQVGKKRRTNAQFHLPGPLQVVRFLTRLEKEMP